MIRKVRRKMRDMNHAHTALQRANLQEHQQQTYQTQPILSNKPLTISIVSTGRCNLSCSMCVTHSKVIPEDYPWAQNPTKDIDLTTFKQIVEKFPEATQVSIIGQGEPVLNKAFFDIVEYGTQKRMRVKSFSNGTTLKNFIDPLLDSSLHTLSISVNSHNEADYQRLTGMAAGSHRTIIKNAKELARKRNRRLSPLVIHASFILDKHNYQEVPSMLALAKELKVDGVLLCNFLPTDHEGFRMRERTITTEDKHIIDFINQAVPPRMRKWVAMPDILDLQQERKDCHCHWSQIRFNGNGDVSSCSMMLLNMAEHGNISDGDAMELWNNEWFQGMRQKFTQPGKDVLEDPCRYCTENYGTRPWK